MKYYRKNRGTVIAVIVFTIILGFFVYRDVIRVRWIKANGEFKTIEGVVAEYYNKASRSRGVMVYYYFLDRNYKTPCTTKLCQNLVVGDSVILKVYLKNPEIIDVIKKK